MSNALLVASGKGGVGTSVVAALTAIIAAERGSRVLLVDAGESGGAQHHLFGLRPATSLWSLADSKISPIEVLIEIHESLTIVAAGASGAVVAPTSDADRRTALKRVSQLFSRYDTVIVDGGSRLDTIAAVQELIGPNMLLVTSADRLALAANYAMVKSVNARRPNAPISVVANRHGETLAEEACDFLVGACSHFLGRTIDVVGALPDDPCLQAAVGAGMSVHDALDGSPAADSMRGVLSRLMSSTPAAAGAAVPAASAGSIPVMSPSSRRWS